ncbi:MAG: tRNA adenosine(34) deaminase TadA [Acidobacteria bacterium]|nr:tRNA adenosine(34) deaminase TadA [Acidobacteriota bacterium]
MALEDSETDLSAGHRFDHPLDEFFMNFALAEARRANDVGEVPIGAVIVIGNQIVGRGHNQPISSHDPTGHAEIIAIREASKYIGNYRLLDASLYVTIEPCVMCAGALVNARIKRLIYGAPDVRAGAVDSVFQLCANSSLNHQMEVTSGILTEACRDLMQTFFKQRRR